jgi:hypothetical protein
MRSFLVGFLLAALTACELPTEPPPSRIPRQLDVGDSLVIEGRVVSGAMNVPLQAANVRVIEAGASVGSGETGRYRIVLPAKYRGRIVPLQVRAIGFKPQIRTIALTGSLASVDFDLVVDAIELTCNLTWR